jgi:hypothetical protein
MAQLDRLIRDARKAMQAHHHVPAPALRSMAGGAAIIKCSVCKREAHIVCKPAPNEIQIGGEAVALGCNVATTEKGFSQILLTIPKDGEISMEAVFGC